MTTITALTPALEATLPANIQSIKGINLAAFQAAALDYLNSQGSEPSYADYDEVSAAVLRAYDKGEFETPGAALLTAEETATLPKDASLKGTATVISPKPTPRKRTGSATRMQVKATITNVKNSNWPQALADKVVAKMAGFSINEEAIKAIKDKTFKPTKGSSFDFEITVVDGDTVNLWPQMRFTV